MVSRSDLGVDLEVIDDLKARAEPLDATRVGCGSVGKAGKLPGCRQFHSIPGYLSCWWKSFMWCGRDIHLLAITYVYQFGIVISDFVLTQTTPNFHRIPMDLPWPIWLCLSKVKKRKTRWGSSWRRPVPAQQNSWLWWPCRILSEALGNVHRFDFVIFRKNVFFETWKCPRHFHAFSDHGVAQAQSFSVWSRFVCYPSSAMSQALGDLKGIAVPRRIS